MASPNLSVKNRIATARGYKLPDSPDTDEMDKSPYSSLANDSTEDSGDDITDEGVGQSNPGLPDAESASVASFNEGQNALDKSRADTQDRNYRTNVGSALSHLAMGTQTPTSSADLYNNIDKQNAAQDTQATADQNRRANVVKAVQAAKAKQQAAATLAQGRSDDVQYRTDALAEARRGTNQAHADSQASKAGDKQTAAYNDTIKMLEQMRGSPAASQAEKDIYASEKVNSLVKQFAPDGDMNALTGQQAKLLESEVAKIANGGQASLEELRGLDPNTLTGKLSKVWSELSNDPTPANAGKFLSSYKDYANRVAGDAQKVIEDRYGRVINSRKDQFTDKQGENLQDQYVNRFKQQNESSSFPKTVKNGTHTAVVKNQQEADEAAQEGFK